MRIVIVAQKIVEIVTLLDNNIGPIVTPEDPNWKGVKRIIGYYTNWSQYRWGIASFYPETINPRNIINKNRWINTCCICFCNGGR